MNLSVGNEEVVGGMIVFWKLSESIMNLRRGGEEYECWVGVEQRGKMVTMRAGQRRCENENGE
jgi:hypothetical protein